jgi:RimJ/RimL family protein N-acetyltransferase
LPKYAFENLKLKEIISFTAKVNKKSQRIMQKIDMQFEKDFFHPKIANEHILSPHVLWKIYK